MPGLLDISSVLQIHPALLFIILVWSLIWKGFALWKSARKSSKIWFIVLLVVNTIGILEILYIYIFSKWENKPQQTKKLVKRKK